MIEKVKLGLIGLGFIGKIHLRNTFLIKSAGLVAVSDKSKEALRYAQEMGIKKTYLDYSDMLNDTNIDAVVIALPTFLHEACTKEVAEAGKHVFLEKPMARNENEGREIIASTRRNGVKLMIGYPLRFDSSFIGLKERMENGLLGDAQNAHAVLVGSGPFLHRTEGGNPKQVPEWWFRKDLAGGGALIDVGSHLINLLRWYFGDIVDIKCYLGYRYNLDVEDYALCVAKFESGTVSDIDVGWFSQEDLLKIELYGTVKHAYADRKAPNKVVAAIQQLLSTSKFWIPYIEELKHFAECIIQDTTPSPSGEDGLKDLESICLAYRNKIVLG